MIFSAFLSINIYQIKFLCSLRTDWHKPNHTPTTFHMPRVN